MDYKELSLAIKLCGSKTHIRECKECPYFEGDYSGDCVTKMTQDASKAIEDLLKYKEAIERMGYFGTLFVKYEGDPRGPVGRAGGLSLEEEAVIMPVITDVDGGKWRPVNSDVLKDLFNRAVSEKVRAEKAETISSELCDDFIDFVTSGVYNAASYCANMRKECVNAYGICDGNNEVCKGFLPKAVILREE